MLRVALILMLVLAQPAASAGSSTSRAFHLGPGRATRTFTLQEPAGVILLNRITIPHGALVVVSAEIPGVAGARVSSVPKPYRAACKRRGTQDVCTQGEEWCPMPKATWHVRLVKLSGPAGLVRFDYVVAPPPA